MNVLITGVSKGIGLTLTTEALQENFNSLRMITGMGNHAAPLVA